MDPFDFINRANADYIERLYQTYKSDPRLLEPHWKAFFAGFDLGNAKAGVSPGAKISDEAAAWSQPNLAVDAGDLVHSYRELGHFIANLDPLGHHRPNHPLLDLEQFGLSVNDLDRPTGQTAFLGKTDGTLRDLLEKLRLTYCSTIGVEYLSISDKAQRDWLQERIEPTYNHPDCGPGCKDILYQIVAAQGFEEFLETKYVGQKRFGLEGGEALIPMMNAMIDDGVELGVEEAVIGMAHRGRLNVLAHVLNKRYDLILSEFEGTSTKIQDGDGDVKYHLGYSDTRTTEAGKKVHISLSYNPSHLELVNPVVEGIVRAKQYYLDDKYRSRVVPILIHGDASFCGQGIVQETLALSEMPYWRTGGTIHIIVNNQIGFTTMPKQGRFTPYPTDVAKMIQAPIFHVNGDDPEAVVHAAKLAIAFRQQFHCDVMIDIWCYRRHGHNEADDPTYTQPVMYREIAEHTRLREIYSQKLLDAGRISQADYEKMKTDARERLDAAQVIAKEERPKDKITPMLGGVWTGMSRAGSDWSAKTAISEETIRFIGERATSVPEGFTVHPKLQRLILDQRKKMSEGKVPIDWGCAEMFALGSLLLEDTPIRFVGQDAQRGTFGHRHSCLHDYNNGDKYYPLTNLKPNQAPIIIVNTMLSELAVLGFEYGFASADPRNFVVWEAQFGDFVNGAQAIIDQFLGAAESKWAKMCGLVLLLPHGYEGNGPEHSNAYLERFLSLSADNNWQVCYPSSASQYFHLLRRQMHRTFRKPLIVMMPKKLLRLDMAASPIKEFTEGQYQLVLDDPMQLPREKVKRLLLCTGKVYYALHAERLKQKLDNVAIVRVEQLYPFPQKEIQGILSKYRDAQDVCWVQEEPKNRGAWTFMRNWLEQMLPDAAVLTYVGREAASSPATGSYKVHEAEEKELVSQALDLPAAQPAPPAQPATPELVRAAN
jgi:2-oxoglutarate dehydrogenase E1 component